MTLILQRILISNAIATLLIGLNLSYSNELERIGKNVFENPIEVYLNFVQRSLQAYQGTKNPTNFEVPEFLPIVKKWNTKYVEEKSNLIQRIKIIEARLTTFPVD